MENILNTIDAISLEVASLLQKSDENGSGVLENGGRSATLTPSFVTEADHHNLQVSLNFHEHLFFFRIQLLSTKFFQAYSALFAIFVLNLNNIITLIFLSIFCAVFF